MKLQATKRLPIGILAIGVIALGSMSVQAKISEPDFILYGNASYFGQPVAPGSNISLTIAGQGVPVTQYSMGSDTTLGGFYALRVPMDSVEPRQEGTARTGEQVTLFINGEAAAVTQIGAQGKAVRLDIDPNNLAGGGPGVSIADVAVTEGNSGVTAMVMNVSLSTNTDQPVSVDWGTSDSGATGGASCGVGIDYISAGGTVTVPAGDMSANIIIDVCGDTVDEADEMLQISLSNAVNGYVADANGFGTIVDDDTFPTLSINDIQVVEPASGQVNAVFTVSLSQVWTSNVDVNYSVVQQTATAGLDYITDTGTVSIPAGSPTTNISVAVLSDAEFEPNETFDVVLSSPVNADLADDTGVATIIDPAFEPTLIVVENELLPASGPSCVTVSPDGKYVYVGGYADDSVNVFSRQAATGALTASNSYTSASTGFENMKLNGVSDVVISDDGAFLYASAYIDGALNIFSRDPSTGELAPGAVIQDATLLNGAASLALSPDNLHLYVSAENSHTVSVYSRDPATGALTFMQSLTDGVDGVDGLGRTSSIIVSADGRHVYATGEADNAFAVFSRDNHAPNAGFGMLAYQGQAKDNINSVQGIVGASAIGISPDGEYLYVTGQADNALARFKRDPWTGLPTWLDQNIHGDSGVAGLQGPLDVRISDDGNYIYVVSLTDNSLVVFQRNRDFSSPDYGKLRIIQNMINGSNGIAGLNSPSDMTISPDDQHLYVVTADSVLVLQRLPILIFGDGFN